MEFYGFLFISIDKALKQFTLAYKIPIMPGKFQHNR